MKWLVLNLFILSMVGSLPGALFRYEKPLEIVQEEEAAPFSEMIISWNAERSHKKGLLKIYARLKTEEWSPWMLYAEWGEGKQTTFSERDTNVRVCQDAVETLNGQKATGFAVKIVTEGELFPEDIRALYVSTNSDKERECGQLIEPRPSVNLAVPQMSQILLSTERAVSSFCSPTSTAAVVSFLSGQIIDPEEFAATIYDQGQDIYGNWVLNVAEAANRLGKGWECYVTRLPGFEELYAHLGQQTPLVVSVRGPLPGSALPYATGHLLVVRGYEPDSDTILCMDPAFPALAATYVSYKRTDFIEAWSRRGRMAYVFIKR